PLIEHRTPRARDMFPPPRQHTGGEPLFVGEFDRGLRAYHRERRRPAVGHHAAAVNHRRRAHAVDDRPAGARVEAVRITLAIDLEAAAMVARSRYREVVQCDPPAGAGPGRRQLDIDPPGLAIGP